MAYTPYTAQRSGCYTAARYKIDALCFFATQHTVLAGLAAMIFLIPEFLYLPIHFKVNLKVQYQARSFKATQWERGAACTRDCPHTAIQR